MPQSFGTTFAFIIRVGARLAHHAI